MDILEDILSRLRSKGYRSSAVRNLILDSLAKSDKPLSVSDLKGLLKKKRLSADRTTLYRELSLLKKEYIISEMQLKGSKRWYELASGRHRHHIVCVKCDKVRDFIGCDHKLIDKASEQSPDFAQIQSHTFVLFGLCKLCAKKHG